MDHQAFAQLLGNYGEFVGAVAVVVTLGYLVVQIRQNTSASKASTYGTIKSQLNSLNTTIGQSPALSELASRAMESFDDLNAIEQSQMSWIWLSYTNTWETLFEVSRDSIKLEALWQAEERSILEAFRLGGYSQWWLQNPFSGTDEFRRHMARLMEHLE